MGIPPGYMGKKITELNRDELLEVIEHLYRDYEYYKSLYLKSEEKTNNMMGDMIKLKFTKHGTE